MALHLNFYHEIHREAQVRARDPIKLAGFAAAGVAVLMLGYYGYRSYAVSSVEKERARKQDEWAKLEPAQKLAEKREVELLALQESNKALIDRVQGRFYWAPLLGQLTEATPPTVQITSLTGERPGPKQPLILMIQGTAAGRQPRSAAEEFRAAVETTLSGKYPGTKASFDANSLEELEEKVEWNGESLPTARFRIRVQIERAPQDKESSKTDAKTK